MFVLIGVIASTIIVYPVEAQEVNTVRGQVINSISGKTVAGVTVEISPADKASTAPVVTGPDGRFELTALPKTKISSSKTIYTSFSFEHIF